MKKKLLITGICFMMLLGLSACGTLVSYDDYDLEEYIKAGEYKGVEAEPVSVSVTEDEVKARIDSNMQAAKTTKDLDKKTPIADGDTVNIDYEGKVNGKAFENGSAKGTDLVIGSGTFIDGFESGIVGKKVGEKFDIKVKFPSDYSEKSLQNKDAVFTVKVNSASREAVPEYNIDFVKNTTEYSTLEEYEEGVKKDLYDEKEEEALQEQKLGIWSDVLEETKVKKYPEKVLDYYIEFNSEQMDEMAKTYNMSRAEMLASYDFGDEKEFKAVNEDSSKVRVKQEMLIEYIAQKENLSYTDKEADKMIKEYEAAGYTDKAIKTQTGRTMDEYVRTELLYEKVLDFLLENAHIKEK